MLTLANIQLPHFDPVALEIGPLAIRWYGLAYVAAFVVGYWFLRRLAHKGDLRVPVDCVGEVVTWLILGVMLGGRLGWWLVYHRGPWEPWYEPLAMWEGGMSFHGGLVGVAITTILICWRRKWPLWNLADALALVTPVGLFFGRIANFINGELIGRPTDLPWGVVYPADTVARHPSQLYEAALEGVLLLVVLWTLRSVWRPVAAAASDSRPRRRDGDLAFVFFGLYGLFRFTVEFTREPDAQVGYLAFGWLTTGQLLSSLMVASALLLLVARRYTKAASEATVVILLLIIAPLPHALWQSWGGSTARTCRRQVDANILSLQGSIRWKRLNFKSRTCTAAAASQASPAFSRTSRAFG